MRSTMTTTTKRIAYARDDGWTWTDGASRRRGSRRRRRSTRVCGGRVADDDDDDARAAGSAQSDGESLSSGGARSLWRDVVPGRVVCEFVWGVRRPKAKFESEIRTVYYLCCLCVSC